ncbi:MAG: short chain dehydrogenase [Ideonella sp. MAG2]|nr:MAG: short chain dehydrogenase [Ideonella sp. MAG2]
MASPQSVLVIGASRGIGLALVRQYRAAGAQVVATARDEAGLARLRELGAKPLSLDVADAVSASGLAWQIDGEAFEVVVINAGVYGPRQDAMSTPTQADFDQVMHTNVLGPMRVLPQVAEALAPDARLAIISSRMGSMGVRSNASGWLYRASKAAVNSVLKDASLVLQGKALCVALHPGWVRTDMGGAGADISPEESATQLRANIAGLRAEHHGCLMDIDGQVLPW